ncbi:MAG: hypothetical protein ACFUZC_16415 [Chthoniobacteraceae bacterium]
MGGCNFQSQNGIKSAKDAKRRRAQGTHPGLFANGGHPEKNSLRNLAETPLRCKRQATVVPLTTHRFFSPLKAAFTSTLTSLALVCGTQAEPGSHPSAVALPYRDASLPPRQRTEDLLGRLTLEEKIKLLGGYQFYTMPIERLGIPSFVMSDGPQGVRTFGKGCAFPCGAALAAT